MDIDLSSIRMELPDPQPGTSDDKAEAPAPERTEAKAEIISSNDGKATDFMAMLTLALSHVTPWIHLQPSTGIQTDILRGATFAPHYSFCLGTGAFSFVEMHALTDRQILKGKVYGPGHLVALKRYPLAMDARDDRYNIRSECYDFIRNELRVATCLKEPHENICQLLFIGWEDHTPVPVLGFELAHYGTVKDVLRSPDYTKFPDLGLRLVADTARGLDALHKRGIVHGDVKPGNILVFHHHDPQRRIVAKLADFSGSIVKSRQQRGEWSPVGGTHVWRAPECYGSIAYDVVKTDIYSFGLTALTILARVPSKRGIFSSSLTGVGECFLARVPEGVDLVEFATALKCAKEDLVLQHALSWADTFLDDPALSEFVEWLLQATVRVDPEDRLSMSEILGRADKELGPEALPKNDSGNSSLERMMFGMLSMFGGGGEQLDDDSTVVSPAQLDDPRVQSASYYFQRRVFNALKAVAQPALDVQFVTVDIDSSKEATKYRILELMQRQLEVADYNGQGAAAVKRALLAAHRMVDSLVNTGFGTRRDLREGLRYASVSGRTGRLLSVLYFTIIDRTLRYDRDSVPAPRLLWLVMTASGGYPKSPHLIRGQYPNLAGAMEILIRGPGGISGRVLRNMAADFDDPEEEVHYLRDTPVEDLPTWYPYRPLGASALCHAAAYGCTLELVESLVTEKVDQDEVELALLMAAKGGYGSIVRLLLGRGAKGTAVDRKDKATALHYLAFVRDDFVGDLAKTLVNNDSSQLSVECPLSPAISSETMTNFGGSPMCCAVVTDNQVLGLALVELHKAAGIPVPDFSLVIRRATGSYQEPILSTLIENAAVLEERGVPLAHVQLDALLSLSLEGINVVDMGIHLEKCGEAQRKTIDALLTAGADPCRGGGDSYPDPYDVAVRGDFLDLLKPLVAFAVGKGVDPKAIFSDVSRFKGKTAIETSICTASWDVFNYLIDAKFCSLDDAFASGDQNALHISATIGDVRFIGPILDAGVSLLEFTSTGYRPFDLAIIARHYDYAQALYEHCSPLDRQKILSADERGFPTFSRLIYSARTCYRHVIDMEAIRLLDVLGAFTIYYNEVTKDTLIRELARTAYSFTRPDSAAFDNSLLKLVISRTAADILNQRDQFGIAPVHYMILNANLPGLALLLGHPDVDINIAAQPPQDGRDLGLETGDTPLDVAAMMRHSPDPHHTVRGGAREVAAYRANVEGIITLLQQKNAKESRGYFFKMAVKDVLGVPDALKITYMYPERATRAGVWRGPERWVEDAPKAGAWPMKLGEGVDNVVGLSARQDEDYELAGLFLPF
ncbi:hypothetical protein B0T21DRAFT_417131 [Apiosordaria backusii]|uniref:Protein kinase domain-containing protein n=1 Tax=Apiosordaria backusii TaxID=314023 RepID=A0AA39ZPZ4_9PEZI|nr:hypothetical protein B0T21DRAFT_417131 [Apiosordaria backusii]